MIHEPFDQSSNNGPYTVQLLNDLVLLDQEKAWIAFAFYFLKPFISNIKQMIKLIQIQTLLHGINNPFYEKRNKPQTQTIWEYAKGFGKRLIHGYKVADD